MYISEVIRTCDALCPNEYSDEEKYMWCDELSAMLTQEHLKKYDKVTVEAEEDGSYLLPEGITFEMVDRIIDGARDIDKRDFRSYGIEYYYGRFGRFVFPVRHRVRGSIDVVYLKKHTPIRSVNIEIPAYFQDSGFYANDKYTDGLEIGDIINIRLKADMLSDEDKFAAGEVFKNVPVLGIRAIDDTECYVAVSDDTFKEITEKRSRTCRIKRVITDETVCDAPYDRMYVDFVNAQICYYQRDFDTYNQHMNLFNQRLNAYQAWLQQRRTQDRDGKIVNWW